MGVAKLHNPGVTLDLDLVASYRVNRSACERRVATLAGRRTVKKEFQLAWLLRAVSCLDLTTLAGDDTPGRVRRLCAKARQPVRPDLLAALGLQDYPLRVGAVCVYPALVAEAVSCLQGSEIPVAAVATGFPAGLTPLKTRLEEIRAAVEAGAREIDIVIARHLVLGGHFRQLYEELCACREACGTAHMKTILATGDLATLRQVGQASLVAMMAGSHFIKTSTGKEAVNATLEVGLVMARAIGEYRRLSGHVVGFKPAGGIASAKQALAWLILMREELGVDWQNRELFRLGASSVLIDIERQISHYVTGNYAGKHHMALS